MSFLEEDKHYGLMYSRSTQAALEKHYCPMQSIPGRADSQAVVRCP